MPSANGKPEPRAPSAPYLLGAPVVGLADAASSEAERERPNRLIWLRRQGLTRREAQAALLAARGVRQDQIAVEMGVAVGTVKATLAHARAKLGLGASRDFTGLLLKNRVIGHEELLTGRAAPTADGNQRLLRPNRPHDSE